MPNPDGTRTRDEHWAEIAIRADRYQAEGLSVEDAIERAGEDHRAAIQAEGDRKIAEVMKFLGVKSH
jgi:hypothetical protein